MLKVTVQNLGDVAILRCHGRIVAGHENESLRNAALSLMEIRTVVLDLARVDRIDAAGLGVLLDLRARAHSTGIQFRLGNVGHRVRQLLELTGLDDVFEICSFETLCPLPPQLPRSAWAGQSP